jgi:hypothetical protein
MTEGWTAFASILTTAGLGPASGLQSIHFNLVVLDLNNCWAA